MTPEQVSLDVAIWSGSLTVLVGATTLYALIKRLGTDPSSSYSLVLAMLGFQFQMGLRDHMAWILYLWYGISLLSAVHAGANRRWFPIVGFIAALSWALCAQFNASVFAVAACGGAYILAASLFIVRWALNVFTLKTQTS